MTKLLSLSVSSTLSLFFSYCLINLVIYLSVTIVVKELFNISEIETTDILLSSIPSQAVGGIVQLVF